MTFCIVGQSLGTIKIGLVSSVIEGKKQISLFNNLSFGDVDLGDDAGNLGAHVNNAGGNNGASRFNHKGDIFAFYDDAADGLRTPFFTGRWVKVIVGLISRK